MKRIAALILALCLLFSVSAMAELESVGTFPFAHGEELTVWAASFSNMCDFENLPMTAWYEEKTGVHINWIEVPNADVTSIFNTSIASGDYPDIYMYMSGDLLTYAVDGVIIPLEDLIDQYSVYLKPILEANPEIMAQLTAPDGHLYGIPRMEYNSQEANANKMWVYTEWLNKYEEATGASEPATVEEFEAMCLWFKENDLNGNGDPNDEIIITGNSDRGLEGGDPMLYVLGAYTYVPVSCIGPNYFYVENGEVKTEVLSDDMREGLKTLNRFYNEGIIGSECFTQTLVDMRAQTTTTKDNVKVACIAAPYVFRMLTAQSIENAVAFQDYTCLNPLPNVKTGEVVTPGRPAERIDIRCVVTSACENTEVAIRWLDYFFNEDVIKMMCYQGFPENGDWTIEEGVTSVDGDNKAVVKHNSEDEQNRMWNRGWIGSTWLSREISNAVAATDYRAYDVQMGDKYYPICKQAGWPALTWCDDIDLAAEKSQLQSLIGTDITTGLHEFIMGIRDVNDDAAWEEFKQMIEDDGLEDFIAICEEYYGIK